MRIRSILLIALLSAISSATRAAEQLSAAIAPYLDERTVLVARIECDRIDIAAARKWVHDSTKDGGAQSQQFLQQADNVLDHSEKWLADFRAAGGKTLFLVVSFGDTPGGSVFCMTPIANGADTQKLQASLKALRENDEQNIAVFNGAVFEADAQVLESLKQFKPSPRPDVETTLVTAGDVPIRIALAPSEDARRVIATLAQKLPTDLGGGPVTTLTNGVHAVSAGIKLPPDPSFLIRIQSKDADSAQTFAGLLRQWIAGFREHERKAASSVSPLLELLGPALEPKLQGDQIVIRITGNAFAAAAQELPAPFIAARQKAALMRSVNNEKQMLLGCLMYANNRKDGPFPDTLEEMIKDQEIDKSVAINPRDPQRTPGYIYIKQPPEKERTHPGQRVVIYEAHDPGAKQIAVAFADGHVDVLDEDAFKKMLEAK